jgi:hypothetical protein
MTHLVAELWSPVWQKRKRISFSPLAKAYLPDMLAAVSTDLPAAKWCSIGRRRRREPEASGKREAGFRFEITSQ